MTAHSRRSRSRRPRLLLAGDVGGTHARLALFDASDLERPLAAAVYPAGDFGGLEEVVEGFLADQGRPRLAAGCFGVAGAVLDNRATLTNLGWVVEGERLAERGGIPRVVLVNDLVATALGMAALGERDLAPLNPGAAEADGNAVLLGVGTGLGMALLVWRGRQLIAVPSEGGHADFAPRDEEEWELGRFLQRRIGGRVSVERVVSGPGLRSIYDFLVERGEPAPEEVRRRMALADPSQVIAEAGIAGLCPSCSRALDLFASALGAVAGNMALIAGASGGVYLGGGIPPRMEAKLRDGTFRQAFVDKGRLRPFVERMPVAIIRRPETALLGAARRAAELAE